MGRLFVVNLEGRIYSCKHCRTHLALCEDVVSKVVLVPPSSHLDFSKFVVAVEILHLDVVN